MKKNMTGLTSITAILFVSLVYSQEKNKAKNPVIFADMRDMSVIRVDSIYYMSSTTMHMSPGADDKVINK
jgi:beta-xylosidase